VLSRFHALCLPTIRSQCLASELTLMLDPLVGSRGLVPKADFEEFMKGGRTTSQGGQPRSGQPSR